MKHLKLIFACLLMSVLSIGQMWAADDVYVELCTSWSSTMAYATAYTHDYTINDLNGGTTTMTLGVQGVYRQSNTNTYFQMNKKSGYFKNTTKLPGKITKIETTWSATKGATKCYFANNAQATSSDATVTVSASTSVTYTPNNEADYYYFNIDVSTGSGSAQMTSCKVYYTTAESVSDKPSLLVEPDELSFGPVGVDDTAPSAQSFTITGSNLESALTVSLSYGAQYDKSVSGSLSPNGDGAVSATVTITPQSDITASAGTKEATVTISGGGLEENVTVALSTEVKAKHNIIFNTNGAASIANVPVVEGETYNITEEVSPGESCEYKTFEGWTTVSSITDNTQCPAKTTSVTMAGADVNLYAIFSKTEQGEGPSGAAVGTTMYSEDFAGFSNSDVPSSTVTGSPTVYGGGSVTYACTVSGTQVYTSGGPNSNNNLLVKSGGGTLTVSGIPTGGATELTLTYAKSGSGTIAVSTSTDNVSISDGTITISNASVETFALEFKNSASSNCRLDDILVVVKTAGGPASTTTYSLDATCCTELGAIGGAINWAADGANLVASGWNATTGENETGYLVKLYNSDQSQVLDSHNTESKDTKTHTFTNPGAGTYWVSVTPTYSGAGNYCAAGDETFSTASVELVGDVVVTFKLNGGTVAGDAEKTQKVEYNKATALTSFADLGYVAPTCKQFGGWASSEANAASGTVAYGDQASITATEAKNLWAVWNAKTISVTDGTIAASVASHSYSEVACDGTLTITCAAAEAYKGNPTVTATGTHGDITVNSATSVTIANVQSDIAVSIAYETTKESYAITWMVDGAALTDQALDGVTTSVYEGSTIANLPSVADNRLACTNKFMGWSRKNYNTVPKTAADYDDLFTTGDGADPINQAETFYAVFAKSGGSSPAGYSLSNAAPADGDQVIIARLVSGTYYALKSDVSTGALTLSNGIVSEPANEVIWDVEEATSGVYLRPTGETTGLHMNSSALKVANGDTNGDIKFSANGNGSFKGTRADDARWIVTSETNGLTCSDTEANAAELYIFKYSAGGTAYSNYVTKCAQVSVPTFSVAAGTYDAAQTVELSCETTGAEIHYTTDGTTPTSASTLYTSAIAVNQSMTIKAIAIKDGESDPVSAAYVLKVKKPTINADKTEFFDKATVTLACDDANAKIYYTIGEAAEAEYSEPFEVNATATVTAVAKRTGWTDSESASQNFTKLEVLDVAGAIQVIDDASGETVSNQYVRGIIAEVSEYSSQYHSLTYWISDNGTDKTLKVYSGKSFDGANFTSIDDLLVGDEVVVKGDLLYYAKNAEYEINYDNFLIERKQRVLSIALSGEYMTECNEGATFSHEGMVVTATYNYGEDADVTSEASWTTPDLNTEGAKTVTVSYIFDGKTVTKNYTITVNHVCTSEVTITKDEEANGTFALSATGTVCGDGDGAEVDVTDIVPAEGYRFKTITATEGDVDNDLKKVTGIKANATIGVEFEEIPSHTINYSIGGEAGNTSAKEGTSILAALPANPEACDTNYPTFFGWKAGAIEGLADDAPAILDDEALVSSATPAVTYYAVFTNAVATDYSTTYTSNVTLSVTGGTKATASKASIAGTEYDAMKLGTNGNAGNFKISVPSTTTKLYLHALGWNGKSNKLTLSTSADGVTLSPSDAQNLTSNTGVSGSEATYTLSNIENDLFEYTLTGVSEETEITIACTERCLVWGVNASDGVSAAAKYMTTCCKKLGALNLTKVMAQHTATLTWDAIAGVTAWSVSGNVKNGAAIEAANIGAITTINEGAQKQCIISNLTTNTQYEFQVHATTIGADYCNDVDEWSIEGTTDADFVITAVASNEGAYGTVEVAGEVITATVADYCRYASTAYTVTSGTATVAQNGNVFTVTPESNCTIQINFEPIPVTGVTMDAELALEIGNVTTLVATVDGEAGANPNVQWSVEQEGNIISVNNGEITALAAGTATITATAVGDNTKSASCVVTVTEHVITPGTHGITFCNAFFGTTGLDGSLSGANLKNYSGSQNDITAEYQKGSGSNMYLKDSEIRLYNGNALVVSVPEGYNITAITGLKSTMTADEGSISGTSWSGKANTVTLSHANGTGNSALTTINVTFAQEAKYAVTFANPAQGGTLAIADGGNAIASGDEVAEDKVLDVTLTPADAYHGGTVTIVKTDDPEVDVTATDYSEGHITIKDYAITVSASFVADAAISVAVADGQSSMGSVKLYDGELNEVESGTTFKPNDDFVIEATPASEDYEFAGWAISAGSDIVFTEENAADNYPALKAGEVNTTFTATFREKAAPFLQATPSALNFATTGVGLNSQLTFELEGENLAENNVTYSISGDASTMFSIVSPAFPIAPEEGVVAETVTVQYAPTAVSENHIATLTITSGEESVEIALSGSAQPAYTAKWYVNGSEVLASTVTAIEGTALTFPENPTPSGDCKNLTFVGWLAGTLAEAQDEEPENLIKVTTGHTMPAANTNYHAVFAEKEGEDVASGYSLSNAAPAAGDQVIIARLVSETYYGLTTASTPSTSALTVSNGVVSEPANNVTWDVAAAESGVYLRPTGASTGLHMNSSALKVANGNDNGDIKFSANGNGSFKGTRADDARWIVTSGTNGLTCSDTQANAAELYVFKYAAGSQATYSNYVTTCVLCNKVTLTKAGEDANNTFALQVNSTDVTSVKTCEGDVEVNIVASPATGNSASFAISEVEGVSINGNVITIEEGADGELTVTATFSPINYNVTMAQTGGANAQLSADQENKHYGDEITVTAEAVEGYAFTGWTASPEVEFADASALSTTFSMPNSDVTVTANYAQIATCAISFMVNGAEVATANAPQTAEYSLADVEYPTVSGFTFLGWSEIEYAEEVENAPAMIESYTPEAGEATKNLYGIYKREQIEDHGHYVLNYTADGIADMSLGYGNAIDVTATDGSEWVVKAYKSQGMQINTGKNASIRIPTCPGKIVNISITCAQAKAVGLSASDYSGSGSITYIAYGTDATSQTLDLSGENVTAGYIVPKNGSTAITNIDVEFDASKTYYTSSPVEKVTITFDANGGEGGCNNAIINKGGQLTICETAPTKSHSDFTGWNTTAEGDGTAYAAGSEYTFNASVTLYAQWADAATFTVTYDKKDGTGTAENLDGQYAGDEITLPAALTKEGYTFQGWKYGSKLYAASTAFTMPATNVEFVAQFRKQSIPVDKMSMVTNASALVNGMQIALGCSYVKDEQSYFAMAGEISNNVMASVENENVSLNNGVATYTNDVVVMTLEQVEGGWKITKDGTNYLNETAIKKLAWTTKENAITWTISFEGNNVKIASANGYIQYNATNPRFTTYASGQKPIQLFGKAVVVSENASISDLGYVEGENIVASGNITLTIDEETNAQSITVQEGATVSVEAATSADNLTVEAGGTVSASGSGTLEVNDLVIETSLGSISGTDGNTDGKSGQIASAVAATGDVYVQIELTQESQASAGWYAFSLPFKVHALEGVFDKDGNKLTNEVHYAIMAWHGDERAQGMYGWKKYREVMDPGVLYIITVADTDYKTLRFKKVADAAVVQTTSNLTIDAFAASGEGDPTNDAGWNGIGNNSLQIMQQGSYAIMQFLDHVANAFKARSKDDVNLMVGSAFFVQYGSGVGITVTMTASTSGSIALAPAREDKAVENTMFEIKLTNASTNVTEDNLFLTAREDALNEYEAGRDVAKMSMGNAKCAQMYVPAYGTKLCAADFQLVNDKVAYPLEITAPVAGSYQIKTKATDVADIYLTRDGAIIWNLSESAYTIDLTKGVTTGYGLLLKAKMPQTPTGVENGGMLNGANGVQKVIIDENVFILRGGQMYDVTGKMVK